jgi:hypothetical protein
MSTNAFSIVVADAWLTSENRARFSNAVAIQELVGDDLQLVA